ncbi:hypothetical protein EBR78_04155 [bacterium]|nr:hypothetical protein [bacterium]NBX82928.1 hypothetical protein [bacterium]
MKKVALLVSLLQCGLWAAPILVQTDEAGIRHFVEAVQTPEPVKEKIQLQSGWRTFSDEVDAAGVLVDKIVNLGKKFWAVIESGRPVVNVNTQYANALPTGVRASELEGFSQLQFKSFRHQGVNFYGVTVYDVTYTLAHRYGGKYQGQGAYIESATVLPQEVYVAWGYKVNLEVAEVSTVNLGSRENPVASIAMETRFRVQTVLQDFQLNHLHEFRGDRAEISSTEVQ